MLSGCCLRSHMRQDVFQIPGWEVRAGLTAMTSSSSSSSSNLCQGNYPIKVEWGCKSGKRSENKGQAEEIQNDWQIFSQEWHHAPTKGAAPMRENIQLWFTPKDMTGEVYGQISDPSSAKVVMTILIKHLDNLCSLINWIKHNSTHKAWYIFFVILESPSKGTLSFTIKLLKPKHVQISSEFCFNTVAATSVIISNQSSHPTRNSASFPLVYPIMGKKSETKKKKA